MAHAVTWNGSAITGIELDANGIAAIMTPAPMKSGVSNDNTLQNGIRMITQGGQFKQDKRTFTLTVICYGASEEAFLTAYGALCDVLKLGRFTLGAMGKTMDVIYESCTQFTQFACGVGKFSLRLTELNPANDSNSDDDDE